MLPIYIDNIAFYLQKSGGITVVWQELIKRLKKCNCNISFLNYPASPLNIFYDSIKDGLNIKYLKLFCLSIQRYLPIYLPNEENPFIFHSTYYRYAANSKAINITTVHDFTYEYFSSGLKKRIHCWQKYRAIRKSKYVICISENTKKDLLKFVPDYPEERIRVIYNGVSDSYHPILYWDSSIIPYKRYTYLLFVGARMEYKNFKFLVKSLKDSDYKLVIVGPDLNNDEIRLLKDCFIDYYYAGRLSNENLNMLYNGAFAFVYPSSYEGFGIPVLEAQKAGCPVIAFNTSSIPEIIGDSRLLLHTLNRDDLLEKLRLLSDNIQRNDIIQKGIENSKRFNWNLTYERLLELYKEAEQIVI